MPKTLTLFVDKILGAGHAGESYEIKAITTVVLGGHADHRRERKPDGNVLGVLNDGADHEFYQHAKRDEPVGRENYYRRYAACHCGIPIGNDEGMVCKDWGLRERKTCIGKVMVWPE